MQETTNYKFKKRELTDVADITATEGNWDIVDTQLNEGDTKVGLLASLATRIKTSIVNAINGLQQDVDAHLAEGMPHQFNDVSTSKTYKWGLKVNNGIVSIIYEEVV